MFRQKVSQGLLLKGILALVLIGAVAAFGLKTYNEKMALKENIKYQAETILRINNIENYSFKSVEKGKIKLPGQAEISKAVLAQSFSGFLKYADGNVWQVEFNGEIKEIEYSVIFDPNGESVIAAYKNDEKAVPGIEALKLEVAFPEVDNKDAYLGKDFLITLRANPSTGYSWNAKFDEKYVTLRSKDFVSDRVSPDTIGSGGTEVFTFAPIKAGETLITMASGRSWESKPTEIKVFKYDIKEFVSEMPVDLYVCKLDADCVKVDSGCCGCDAGGNASSVNKIYEKDWKGKLLNDCKEIMCPAVISNDPSCSGVLKCINNKCIIK